MLCSASRRTGAILLVADSCVVCLVPSCRLRYTVNASTDSGLLMQYRAFQPAELGGTWPTSSITCKYCRRAGCAGKECRTRACVRPSQQQVSASSLRHGAAAHYWNGRSRKRKLRLRSNRLGPDRLESCRLLHPLHSPAFSCTAVCVGDVCLLACVPRPRHRSLCTSLVNQSRGNRLPARLP